MSEDVRFRLSRTIVVVIAIAVITIIAIGFYWSNLQSNTIKSTSSVSYGNALELQYAQPFIDAQNKPTVAYSNALEMQYAQPWIEDAGLFITVTGKEVPFDCHSSLDMLYACQNGYGGP